MAIYDASGNVLSKAYDESGEELLYAYDSDGSVLYQKSSSGIALKVMTYNVGQWYIGSGSIVPSASAEAYYALQNGIIQRANADVLCINEYRDDLSSSISAYEMLQQYYPYIITQQGTTNYQNRAICSKYPITNYTKDAESYYLDTATIIIGAKEVTIGVLHMNTSYDSRVAKLDRIINQWAGVDDLIICGDFNTTTIYNDVTTTADDYNSIISPLLSEGFNLANCSDFGFMHTYNENNWYGCLDNIVTSSNIEITNAYVDATKQTDSISDKVDHMPLIAELVIS